MDHQLTSPLGLPDWPWRGVDTHNEVGQDETINQNNHQGELNVKQSRIMLAAALAVVFLGAAACPGASDITPGGACEQIGSKHTNSNGYAYTCQQVPGGNRIWQQDSAVLPDSP